MSDIGHNSVAADQLRQFIERVERIDEERRSLLADANDVYAEAKSVGFDVKIMRQLVRLRRKDENSRKEEAALLDLYASAIGLDLI